jgi:ATP-binding protein involved in chromosome partitioning
MARFSSRENRMPDTIESALKESLAKFVVPQTNRALGAHGTSFTVASSVESLTVSVRCGFPVDRSRDELLQALNKHLDGTVLGRSVNFDLTWAVKSHSVQPSLKALPNIRNIVAIA